MLKWNRKNFLMLAAIALSVFTGNAALADGKMVYVNGEYRPAYREGEVIVKYRDTAVRSML